VITEEDAVCRYPELARLIALRDTGWTFRVWVENGCTIGIVGSRSAREFTDALFIAGRHDVRAVRLLADAPGVRGGIVWDYSGSLADTVDELVALPTPGERLAPRLIIARGGLLDLGP
jgi:hypothetical protein